MKLRPGRMAALGLVLAALVVNGCAGSSKYQSTDQIDDLTVGMSDTDVKLLANKIIANLLAADFISRYDKPVTISLLPIVNSTSEFVNTDALIGDKIMEAIINSGSGTFEFVDRKLLDESIKEAQLAADGLISDAEATKLGRAAGVKLLMAGELTSIRTNTRSKDQRYYKLSLRLVDTERNTVVWIAAEDIRKLSTKGWMQ
jgi:PBP1b-binding outer membrane lipoprotein LpoB